MTAKRKSNVSAAVSIQTTTGRNQRAQTITQYLSHPFKHPVLPPLRLLSNKPLSSSKRQPSRYRPQHRSPRLPLLRSNRLLRQNHH